VKVRFETFVLVVSLALVGWLVGDCVLRAIEHFSKVKP